MIERRTLITGLVALVAAPAIVKAASLMKVAPTEKLRTWDSGYWEYNPLLDKWTQYSRSCHMSIDQITRESVRLFQDSNEFIRNLDHQYENEFAAAQVGDVVRIRLPNDYVADEVSHPADAFAYAMKGPPLNERDWEFVRAHMPEPQIPTVLGVAALAVAAAPVVEQVLQKPVTRRFWK